MGINQNEQVLSEGRWMEEFLFSEGNGNISREKATVSNNQDLAAGTVVQLSGSELVAATGLVDTDGNIITQVVGVLSKAVDTTAAGPNGNVDATDQVYIARDAEVVEALLTLPAGATER